MRTNSIETAMQDKEGDFAIGEALTTSFFEGRCVDIAESLIGNLLIHEEEDGLTGGIIVETEAYLGKDDPACHLSSGRTKRNKPFFTGRGTIYVFKIYHYNNLNFISEYKSRPECILIRAIYPTHGIDVMKRRRRTQDLAELTTGPGKLSQALDISKEQLNNTNLETSPLAVLETDLDEHTVSRTSRVGISQAEDWPLRYCMEKNNYISQPITSHPDTEFSIDEFYADWTHGSTFSEY